MKKIYIGGFGSCDIHHENEIIGVLINNCDNFQLVSSIEEANLILLTNTCIGTYRYLTAVINMIDWVNKNKQEDAKVIVSGCIAKGVKFNLTSKQKDILASVTIVKPDKIIEYVAEKVGFPMDKHQLEIKMPYSLESNHLRTSIVEGCLNNCSFCKANYMNFALRSIPWETLELFKTTFEKEPIENCHLTLFSSNLSLYGVDLYSRQRAHEAIKLLTSAKNIKWATVGTLINYYPELVKEIIENEKIKSIHTSIESGSPRIYELMNRPISLEKLTETIKLIRRERADIIINTEFICGFPTETVDDLKKTIALVEELDINPQYIHPYMDSKQVPAHNLPQHTFAYNEHLQKYATEKTEKLRNKYEEMIENGEQVVLCNDDEHKYCSTLLVDGSIWNISYACLDKKYAPGEIILPNTIRPKQLIKIGINNRN